MNDQDKSPCLEFDTIQGIDLPIACRLNVPHLRLASGWFATKSSGLEIIDTFRVLGHVNCSQAFALRDQLRESFLPNDDEKLDNLIATINGAMTHLIRRSLRVPPKLRGMTKGDKWKFQDEE